MRFSLPEPDRDLAMVMPVSVLFFTAKPLLTFWILRTIYNKYFTMAKIDDSTDIKKPAKIPDDEMKNGGVKKPGAQESENNNTVKNGNEQVLYGSRDEHVHIDIKDVFALAGTEDSFDQSLKSPSADNSNVATDKSSQKH